MKYTDINIKSLTVHISRVRRSRHYKVSIHEDGEVYATYPWYGNKKELVTFLESKYDFIVKSKEKISRKAQLLINRYNKEELLNIINNYVDKYVKVFNADGYNISVNKVSIRDMNTRLGSCTPSRKTIRFSSKLCKYSDEYIEYVVVHELAHLVECNHSKKFWDIVKRYIKLDNVYEYEKNIK